MGFIVFKDDEKLKQGSTIAEELLKAIKESRYAVIVISETFASSKWCLKELSMIMESRKIGLEVLPVFYHVNPSDVRKQKGIFVQAFDKHRGDPEVEEVDREAWRATLKELGGISGWHIDGSSEATVIEQITAKIFYGLFRLNSSKIFKNLVGIDSKVEKLVSSLCLEMDDVRYIGIHGMGGVGKTTVAEVLYETICFKFEAHCLIYGKRNDQSRDIEELQQEVIHKILKEDNKIWNHYDGTKLLAMRLCNKKVLIVFDDINKDQLEALAGCAIWFGGKSRIIITSRDCQFWKPLVNDDNAYEIKPLNQKDALQLFCWEVFGKPKSEEKFVKLSKNITKYYGGLPLAIKVIGSSLVGKGIEVWNSTCDFLEENLHAEVSKKLEISYKELDIFPKQLFLDIACLFNGMDAHRIIPIWESLDCHPKYCIDILRHKSLLELSWCRQFHMHNLLQKMGQQIVYNEDLRQPGRRSRLWYPDDIFYVLNNKSGTKAVEGIVLNLALQKQERLSFEGFSKLTRLKVLIIRRKESYSSLNFLTWFGHPSKFMLSKELRLLEWMGYPLISLPINFQFDNLIELRMPYSKIKQLWSGRKNFDKLKYINLSHSDLMEIDLSGVPNIEEICLENCRNLRKVQLWSRRKNLNKLKYTDLSHSGLIEMSDLNGVPNVEKINLEFCRNLRKVHHSIGNLKQLRYLSLLGCKKLEGLPEKINLKFLEWLDLCHCLKLKKFPEIMGNMTSLRYLDLSYTAIKTLPFSFQRLSTLSNLSLSGLGRTSPIQPPKDVLHCPCGFYLCSDSNPSSFWFLQWLVSLSSLRYLNLKHCGLSKETFPSNFILPSLKMLDLSENRFTIIPKFLGQLSNLEVYLDHCNLSNDAISHLLGSLSCVNTLNLRGNPFTTLPDSFCLLSNLEILDLGHCKQLKALPKLPLNLKGLYVYECSSLGMIYHQTDMEILRRELDSKFWACVWLSATTINGYNGTPYKTIQLYPRLTERISFMPYAIPWGPTLRSKIPKWFNQRSNSLFGAIQSCVNVDLEDSWKGYALFVVYEVHVHGFPQFVFQFQVNDIGRRHRLVLSVLEACSIGANGFWVYLTQEFWKGVANLDSCGHLEVSIVTNCLNVEIKECGSRLIRECDISEFFDVLNDISPHGLELTKHSFYFKLSVGVRND